MPEIYFREMVPDDADSVAIVEEKCFSMPWSRESFWRDASNENTLYLLAVDKEKEDDAQGDRSEPGQHPVKIGLDVRLFVHHDKLHSCCGKREYPQRLLNFVASDMSELHLTSSSSL